MVYRAAGADKVVNAGTVNGEVLYPFDITDTRQVVGYADNVFVGSVVGQVGTVESDGGGPACPCPAPCSLWRSNATSGGARRYGRRWPGRRAGGVPCRQGLPRSGYGERRPRVAAGPRLRRPLLKEGEPYLFATSRSDGPGDHRIVAAGSANEKLDGAAERERLTEAYEREEAQRIDPTELEPLRAARRRGRRKVAAARSANICGFREPSAAAFRGLHPGGSSSRGDCEPLTRSRCTQQRRPEMRAARSETGWRNGL